MNYRSRLSYYGKKEIFHTLGMLLSYAADIAFIGLSMRLFPSLAGFLEIMFLFSFELLAYSLANTIVWFAGNSYDLIIKGKLDECLVKPVNPFLFMSAKYFEIGYIGQFTVSIILVGISLHYLQLQWKITEWFLYIVLLVNSTFIYIGFTTIPSLLSFWFGNTRRLTNIFRWSFKRVIQYPISIYPKPIRIILTVVLPYGLINYYPTLVLLKKVKIIMMLIIVLTSLLVGIFFITCIRKLWEKGLSKYESSGS